MGMAVSGWVCAWPGGQGDAPALWAGRARLDQDQTTDGNRYRFHDTRIAGRGTIRVHTGSGRDARTDLFQGKRDHVRGNRADTATLRHDRNRTVDIESWRRRR
ncbi:hypothetical protein OHA84_35655 [Streptomyces sp. NBC_00513]|uniref:hypothetical protein n=1 Tax=unclassified Streptomyces TaxID=2593676 RepID=UPI002250B15F|nr:hypothetical protein [Streptomyces sp. NBC_00424]MCX5071155.1 hypothetical protein [Streptomyces sp. NBC_00424]WUD45427.1 hypothetical protein OHA84_35655 [Streptomyces sp. NBC_00513]